MSNSPETQTFAPNKYFTFRDKDKPGAQGALGKVSVKVTEDCNIDVTHSRKNDTEYWNIGGDTYNAGTKKWYHSVHGNIREKLIRTAQDAYKVALELRNAGSDKKPE